MLIFRFTPSQSSHQVPHGMKYMMVTDCQSNVDIYAGGIGGHLIASIPYQGSRVIAWPENANVVEVDFITQAVFPANQYVDIWFSNLPIRIDMIGQLFGDSVTNQRGYQAGLTYQSPEDLSSQAPRGAVAPITTIAGMQIVKDAVQGDTVRSRIVGVARSVQPNTDGVSNIAINDQALRVATTKVKAPTYYAQGVQSVTPYSMSYNPLVASRFCISYIEFFACYPDLVYLLGCRVRITENNTAVKMAVSLDRTTNVDPKPATTSVIPIRRTDGLISNPVNLPDARRVTVANQQFAGSTPIKRELLWLGALGVAPTTNPIAEPYTFDLVPNARYDDATPMMPIWQGINNTCFAVHIETDGPTTLRCTVEWLWTQNPIDLGYVWT